ncbi:MAG: YraN family protein [Gammaproteobacteria bacterium]
MAQHLLDGHTAEESACRFLRSQGLKLITRNYRCRYGELDLIMTDRATLICIEVRYRRSGLAGGPLESITDAKKERLALAMRHFLQAHAKYQHLPLRFDVVGLSGNTAQAIDWRKAAISWDS